MAESTFVIATPYNTGKTEDIGKKYLLRMPERKWFGVGTILAARNANGREYLYTAITPDFQSSEDIVAAWGTTDNAVRNVVAIMRRDEIVPEEDTTMDPAPDIE